MVVRIGAPKLHVCTDPLNVASFGNRVFADGIIWALNLATRILLGERRENWTHRQREDGHMKTERRLE